MPLTGAGCRAGEAGLAPRCPNQPAIFFTVARLRAGLAGGSVGGAAVKCLESWARSLTESPLVCCSRLVADIISLHLGADAPEVADLNLCQQLAGALLPAGRKTSG